MTDLTKFNLTQTIFGLKNKEFSSVELTKAYINNIEKNSRLNAFITTTFDLALNSAKIADNNISKNQAKYLEGIPLAIKDIFCTKDVRTSSASKMLENFIPPYESTVTQKLWDEGAIMLGKTNMDEFAMGSGNLTSYFGPAINPYKKKNSNEDLVPGGSSGGSSAAVAANLCVAATGSDTGGSVRQPASLTNTVGVKPTYGRCSRYGMVAFASSLDQAGIFTKNVLDSAVLLKIISGYDKKDSTSSKLEIPDFGKIINKDVKGKRIGIVKEYRNGLISSKVEKIWQKGIDLLKQKGATIEEISIPHIKYSAAVYHIVASCECSSNLARYDGIRYGHRTNKKDVSLEDLYQLSRSEGFGEEVKRRILIGTYCLSSENFDSYYQKAQKVRRLILNDFNKAFERVDTILIPTTTSVAFPIKDSLENSDPVKMYLYDSFTASANLAGFPAISVPFGFDEDSLPMGLQIIAKHFDEKSMFDVALALENR